MKQTGIDLILSPMRVWLLKIIRVFPIIVLTYGCSSQPPLPPIDHDAPAVQLPAAWTPTNADAKTIPTEAEEPAPITTEPVEETRDTPTPTPIPGESWWVMSFGAGRKFRIRSIFETEEGMFLIWAQEPGVRSKPNRDLFFKILQDGRLAWQKSITPMTSEVHNVQLLEDGSLLLVGFDRTLTNPFSLHLGPDGEIHSEQTYLAYVSRPEKEIARIPLEGGSLATGSVRFFGEVEGYQYIEDFVTLPEGDVIAAGPIYGTTTGAHGGTFSALRGLWATRINTDNIVVWKKVFETKAGPLFTGEVFEDGTSVMVKDNATSNSIVKIDSRGNVLFWRHFSGPGGILSLSQTNDSGILLIDVSKRVFKLDKTGSIVWKREVVLDDVYPRYAFETSDGHLILVLQSSTTGMLISRFDVDKSFPNCEVMQLDDPWIGEHQPLLPANIGASVDIRAYLEEHETADHPISMSEAAPALIEICRHILPTTIP